MDPGAYPDESSGKLQKTMKSGKVSAEDFFIAAMERRCMCCLMSIKRVLKR